MKRNAIDSELSRPLQTDKIPLGGVEEHIVASPAERAALAERFGLIEVSLLEAHLNVDHAEGKMLAVTGNLLAEIVQQCVVTLEPVPETVRDSIDVLFAPPHLIGKEPEGQIADVGEAELPEPIEGGVIDLGELVAQHLATAMNPYPRKPGAAFKGVEVAASPQEAGQGGNPFSKLKEMTKGE